MYLRQLLGYLFGALAVICFLRCIYTIYLSAFKKYYCIECLEEMLIGSITEEETFAMHTQHIHELEYITQTNTLVFPCKNIGPGFLAKSFFIRKA